MTPRPSKPGPPELPFDFPAPNYRNADDETSRLAAWDARKNANKGRVLALAHLCAHPEGLTDFELADLTGWQQTSIGKRRGECVAAGLVEKLLDATGGNVKRPAPSGSLALVWRITHRGLRVASGLVYGGTPPALTAGTETKT